MRKVEHTKGTWKILPEEHDKPYIRIRGTTLGGRYKIANVLGANYEEALASEAEETRANAKRIVDCVNACEGMQNPEEEVQAIESANNLMRDYLIRLLVQASASSNPAARGVESIALNGPHTKLCQRLSQDIANVLGEPVRGDKGFIDPTKSARGKLAWCDAGGIIVETFFLSNPTSLAKYKTEVNSVVKALVEVLISEN